MLEKLFKSVTKYLKVPKIESKCLISSTRVGQEGQIYQPPRLTSHLAEYSGLNVFTWQTICLDSPALTEVSLIILIQTETCGLMHTSIYLLGLEIHFLFEIFLCLILKSFSRWFLICRVWLIRVMFVMTTPLCFTLFSCPDLIPFLLYISLFNVICFSSSFLFLFVIMILRRYISERYAMQIIHRLFCVISNLCTY